ncbi:receptor activity-modifying protein 2 isoform X2 [Kryptolebias marmoratus]|uniref:Receptor (G protein-coupled) activity modifying protein 2 n=1 Tax=Kryptolebias marmoratus TaxID=37003 RepID=A0A3Q3GSQ2_KRYMA|nr:receptor activity-modifying protein 2 isoform X2 [Kryptolebias marmoratus]
MNTALLGKMTLTKFSFVFSGGLAALLIWGCSTVTCLVNDQVTVQPVTITADVLGDTAVASACGNNSRNCPSFCEFCDHTFKRTSMDCLSLLVNYYCLLKFKEDMAQLNNTDWCIWDKVNSLYSNLSECTEEISDCLVIPWPNPFIEETFVNIHSEFFQDCSTEEFSDPLPPIIFALVITPIALIPVMVSLVVLKTKNGDGTP